MPIRLLAIDLDGTLLNSRSEISVVTRQALADAAARGVQLVVVTGRRHQSARPFLEQLPCPATLIASNGALIGSSAGEVLHRDFLPRRTAQQVLRSAREFRPYAVAIFHGVLRGQVVMQQGASPEGPLSWYMEKIPEYLELVPELEEALKTDPVQVMFGGPPGRIEPLEELVRESPAGADVHLTWTKYYSRNLSLFDVMNRGCSKGGALALWAKRLGIEASEVMAIGDNYNDLEMLCFAGHAVLMGNCPPGLASDGWRVTRTNDLDGVAAAIRAYVLRDQ